MGIPPPEQQEKFDTQWQSMRVISRNCRLTRKKLGITQMDLAFSADIEPYQVSRLETDKYYCVAHQTLCLVARGLNLTISELCDPDLFSD